MYSTPVRRRKHGANAGPIVRVLLSLVLLIATAIVLGQRGASASEYGRIGFSGNPMTNGGGTCTSCHGLGATIPTVTLSGPTAVIAGGAYTYRLTIQGGPGIKGGFNVSTEANAGVLAPAGPDAQLILAELTHSAPKAFSGGEVSFEFQWTAPAWDDIITLYGAGNSTNGDDALGGDGVRTTALDVTVSGGSGTPPPTPTPEPGVVAGDLTWKTVAGGLTAPIDIQNAGDARLFVVEQPGQIRVIGADGVLRTAPFLDITDRVHAPDDNWEAGLLGLAFHPSYATNGYFYIYYTALIDSQVVSRVSRFTVSANPDAASSASERRILEIPQPVGYHFAGQLRFGPDGMLYIAVGDGGPQGDPEARGQDIASLRGKILRIDVTSATGAAPECDASGLSNYRVPAGNPYVNKAGCDEIWQLGLRNPWRFSFDSETGDMWIGDVGYHQWEEINTIPHAESKGINWGWRCREGAHVYNDTGCAPASAYTDPVWEYAHAGGRCSVTGGFVYRGNAWPQIQGHYFFTDFCTKEVWSLYPATGTLAQMGWGTTGSGEMPASFGVDRAGELYIAFRTTGTIARLEDPAFRLVQFTDYYWLPLVMR